MDAGKGRGGDVNADIPAFISSLEKRMPELVNRKRPVSDLG
jgi:hypothetical protein